MSSRDYASAYYRVPENKAKALARAKTPAAIAKKRAYDNTPAAKEKAKARHMVKL